MKLFTEQNLESGKVFALQMYTPTVNYPVMYGALEAFGVGVTRFAVRWQAATVTDGVIAGYQISLDAGAYVDLGTLREYVFLWLPTGTEHIVAVRAYDTEGRYSPPISRTVTLAEVPPTLVRDVLVNGRIDNTIPIVLVGIFPRNQ